jgi:hypothetical protein
MELQRAVITTRKSVLVQSSSDDRNNSSNTSKKAKGVYVRPSAVIERGSGFFFPGLEGARVRLVAGTVLLGVTTINHFLSSSTSAFSEILAVGYSLLVLLQGAIESSKEGRVMMEDDASSTGSTTTSSAAVQQLSQQWNSDSLGTTPDNQEAWRNRVEWAAASFLALTPATHMMLLRQPPQPQSPRVEYWLGETSLPQTNDSSTMESATAAALNIVQQSSGGRVAVPSDHPAVVGLIPDEPYRRCVVLQRISPHVCWMVASKDLLASFTKQDLQWLGQLAQYVHVVVQDEEKIY